MPVAWLQELPPLLLPLQQVLALLDRRLRLVLLVHPALVKELNPLHLVFLLHSPEVQPRLPLQYLLIGVLQLDLVLDAVDLLLLLFNLILEVVKVQLGDGLARCGQVCRARNRGCACSPLNHLIRVAVIVVVIRNLHAEVIILLKHLLPQAEVVI